MTKALNLAIENVPDQNEQIALALISHLAPALGPWREGEDLREERGLLEKREKQVAIDVSASKSALDDLNQRLGQVAKSGDVIGLIVGGLAAIPLSFFTWKPMIAAGLAAIGFGVFRYQQAKRALLDQKGLTERELAKSSDELGGIKQRLIDIDNELHSRDGGFPDVAFARVSFPVQRSNVVGFDVAIDLSATVGKTELSTVDLSKVGSKLHSVSDEAKKLAVVPVLLAPSSDMQGSQAVERLYGEEDRLRKLVNGFIETLSEIDDFKIRLPLVPARSEVARRLAMPNLPEIVEKGTVRMQADVADITRIGAFVERVNSAKTTGEKVLAELKATYQVLALACESYSNARLMSVNYLHQQLHDVLNRSSWCSARFYCPRTIQSQAYVEALLQIEFERAHELAFEELMQKLESDPEIAKRAKDRPELVDGLWRAYGALHDLALTSGESRTSSETPAGNRTSYHQDQYEELVKQFRISLSRMLTGAMHPVLTFSPEARMCFDPLADEWRSDLVPYVYSTSQIQQYGQVLKVHTDVLFPLWEHLWTEKADFRKSELFRTNEALNRMGEKETEKLIEVGNQFRADMRPIRENVHIIESELKAKGDEIGQFRDAMKDLGVLTERQMRILGDDHLKRLTLGDGSVLEKADQIESWLAFEPKSQADRRGMVHDPVDLVRTPDVLIGYEVEESGAPRLPSAETRG
jgi:hypothetical protein